MSPVSNVTSENLTDESLIALAGEAAFARGHDYFENGRVECWSRKGNTLTAAVSGSELYQVRLSLGRRRLEGYCDCPASEGFDFCKHCVATALQYREDSERQAQLEGGAVEQRIEAYLNRLSKAELSRHLLALILEDTASRQEWSIKADVALNRMDAREIRKRITAAIPTNKHLFRYPQVRTFFGNIEPVVELLEQQLPELEAASGLQLAEYALQRIHRALESVDDSGGFRMDVVEHLQNLHQAILWRLGWDKAELVAYLLDLDAGPYADMYPEFPFAYQQLLEEEGMALVFQRLQDEWDALPALRPGAGWEQRYPYARLEHLLRQRAAAAGDTPAIIRLLEKTATDERHFLDLCELCMEVDDWKQAGRYLAEARAVHKPARNPWNSDFRLERNEQKIWVHQGELTRALDLQWRIFRGSLTLADYQQLLDLAARCNAAESWGDKARTWLQSRLGDADKNPFSTRSADILIEIAISENDTGLALETCRQYRVGATVIAKLARACADRPEAAIPLYARLAEHEVQAGKNAAYRRGVAWLLEARELAARPGDRRVFDETLEAIREQFKAKRNFMRFLDEAFKP
jgi:uncharacterized Zn finger protein